MKAKLFWRKKELTVGEDGLIKFSLNSCHYSFQIYDPELFFKVKGALVKVYFDELEIDTAHLFDSNNRYLGIVNPRLVYDGSNPEIIEHHRALRKNIDQFAKEKRKRWKSGDHITRKRTSNLVTSHEYQDFLVDNCQLEEKLFIQLNGITNTVLYGPH